MCRKSSKRSSFYFSSMILKLKLQILKNKLRKIYVKRLNNMEELNKPLGVFYKSTLQKTKPHNFNFLFNPMTLQFLFLLKETIDEFNYRSYIAMHSSSSSSSSSKQGRPIDPAEQLWPHPASQILLSSSTSLGSDYFSHLWQESNPNLQELIYIMGFSQSFQISMVLSPFS